VLQAVLPSHGGRSAATELCGGGSIDELFELVLCRGLDRLVVDSVVPISDGLANELTLTEATAAVDHDEIPVSDS